MLEPLFALDLSFDEFVALKAFVTLQMSAFHFDDMEMLPVFICLSLLFVL